MEWDTSNVTGFFYFLNRICKKSHFVECGKIKLHQAIPCSEVQNGFSSQHTEIKISYALRLFALEYISTTLCSSDVFNVYTHFRHHLPFLR